MKTLLVIAQHPALAEAIRAAVNPEYFRVVHRVDLNEAEPLLAHGLADACLLDADLTSVQAVWSLEKIRRRAPKCPILVFTSEKQWEWEEEAYLKGVTQVLNKPVRAKMLNTILDRLWFPVVQSTPAQRPPQQIPSPGEPARIISAPSAGSQTTSQTLQVLRDFSGILTHSLNAEAMLKQFLLLLREIVAVNRAAIFLKKSTAPELDENPRAGDDSRRLRPACAIGLSAGLLEHFELSLDAGIAGHLFRTGRILRRSSDESVADLEAQQEFELLGAQVAIPILDRESLLGVAVFDGRITGEALSNPELELIFHLLEQLSLAIKNIWLHDQVANNNDMLADILRELSGACIVVSRDLTVLHANKMARRYFTPRNRQTAELEFADLPPALGSKVYQVLRTGAAIGAFRHQPEGSPNTIFNVTIAPFQRQGTALPNAALLMVEDLTQSEQLKKLEVEAANLRLIKTMADRLAHEIGNALVPLSTHQQLLSDKYKDPEFRASLDTALADGVKRISRLTSQMRFLARDSLVSQETFPLAPLIEEAYLEAQKYHPSKTPGLNYDMETKPIVVSGDRAALKHAFAEVMLNALQANPGDPKIGVRFNAGEETPGLNIEIQDNGGGFSAEAMKKASAPFFTTRNVGLGLGLTVSRKIIETHHGKLEIVEPKTGHAGIVRISLPMESSVSLQS